MKTAAVVAANSGVKKFSHKYPSNFGSRIGNPSSSSDWRKRSHTRCLDSTGSRLQGCGTWSRRRGRGRAHAGGRWWCPGGASNLRSGKKRERKWIHLSNDVRKRLRRSAGRAHYAECSLHPINRPPARFAYYVVSLIYVRYMDYLNLAISSRYRLSYAFSQPLLVS